MTTTTTLVRVATIDHAPAILKFILYQRNSRDQQIFVKHLKGGTAAGSWTVLTLLDRNIQKVTRHVMGICGQRVFAKRSTGKTTAGSRADLAMLKYNILISVVS